MGFRESMQSRPAVWVGIAAVIAAAAVFSTVSRSKAPAAPQFSRVWYYDLGTGDYFPAGNTLPPVDAPSGADQGVSAFIYACGACEPASWTVAYLQTYTPQAKAAMQLPNDTPEQMQAKQAASTVGRLIALPPAPGEKAQWIASSAPAAAAILARANIECPESQRAALCQP